jgi:hypothetical protein
LTRVSILKTVIPGREALASEPGIQRRARLLDSGFVAIEPLSAVRWRRPGMTL